MISISAETKPKDGFSNKFRYKLFKDKSLWDFTKTDPKLLAYFLSGFQFEDDYSKYDVKTELVEAINDISDEAFVDFDPKEKSKTEYTDPAVLLKNFQNLTDLTNRNIENLIQDHLNPNHIDVKLAKKSINGLISFLQYQNKRGALVKLVWA